MVESFAKQPSHSVPAMDDAEAFAAHYALGFEQGRLTEGGDSLELVRTLELLETVLPAAPADVLDVGGGAGVYAARLARSGYRVQLVDVVPLHVEQARAVAAELPEAHFTAILGDARDLSAFADGAVDVVLLLGPLYHLTERSGRVARAGRLVLRQRGSARTLPR